MKKNYESVELKIVVLQANDVVRTSNVLGEDNVGLTPDGRWDGLWDK